MSNVFPKKPLQFNIQQYYQNTNLVDNDETLLQNPSLFILADYMKPTKRIEQYTIIDQVNNKVIHNELFIPQVRQEDVPNFQLDKFFKQKTQKPFDKSKSVFKLWIKDSPNIIQQCLDFDLQYWRVPKTIKDPKDLQGIQLITDNYEKLKLIFISLNTDSHYPFIGMNDFNAFCREYGIQDNTILSSTIDRMFIATKVGCLMGSQVQLARHEFIEILVRISNAKYRENKVAFTYTECLRILLDDLFLKFKPEPWQQFRDIELWNAPIDEIFKQNEELIKKVHQNLFPKYQLPGSSRCIDFIQKKTTLNIADTNLKYIYAMSKMTIKDELKNIDEYKILKYVEFLEFIARLAQLAYENEKEISLDIKIDKILDQIFEAFEFKKNKFKEANDDLASSSESCKIQDQQINEKQIQIQGYEFISRNIQ